MSNMPNNAACGVCRSSNKVLRQQKVTARFLTLDLYLCDGCTIDPQAATETLNKLVDTILEEAEQEALARAPKSVRDAFRGMKLPKLSEV